MSTRVLLLGMVSVSGIIVAAACSTTDSIPLNLGASASGSTLTTTPNGGIVTGAGGSGQTTIDIGTTGGPRQPNCEDPAKPETCSCVNIASIGMVAHYGANNDSTDAFMTWLDTKSTAGTVAQFTTQREAEAVLTATGLANFDIVVLQHMTSDGKQPAWVLRPETVDAVRAWVMDKGGALIALTGYESSNIYEIAPTNQLLGFTGIQINADDITGQGAAQLADCNILCPPSNTACCSCWHGPQLVTGWDPAHEISTGIIAEPIFRGRTISPGDAQVVATHRGMTVAVAKQVGAGRVFVYGDEWITYTSQWQDDAAIGLANATNPCYDATTGKYRTAANVFQVGRLWYNAIRWLQPAMTCFTVTDIVIL